MDEGSRFIKASREYFVWAAALPDLFRRTGRATNMPTISGADKMALAAIAKLVTDLVQRVRKAVDDENTDDIIAITDQLREEIVKANLILDQLKVPDSEQ